MEGVQEKDKPKFKKFISASLVPFLLAGTCISLPAAKGQTLEDKMKKQQSDEASKEKNCYT